MRWNRKAAVVLLAVTLTGCGSFGNAGEQIAGTEAVTAEALTAEEQIQLAQKTMATITSMAADMKMEMDLSVAGEPYETVTTAEIFTQKDPMKLQMTMDMTMGDETESQVMQMYAEESDGKLMSYLYSGDTWQAQTMDISALGQYQAEETAEFYLEHLEQYSNTAQETIAGVETSKIEGVLTGDAMKQALQNAGMTDTMASFGVEEETIFDSLQDVSVTLWIDEEGYVRKYEMDMTALMQTILTESMKAIGISEAEEETALEVTTTRLSMTCRSFNAIEEIQIPEAAKTATLD